MQLSNDSQYHPVAYFKPSQENWDTTTKEAFAVVLAVRHWYVYLIDTNLTLNTNHNLLVYLRLQKDPLGKNKQLGDIDCHYIIASTRPQMRCH